jgi:hypothetical protein
MAGDVDALRARSKELDERLADDEALEVNAAILALVPADPVATNRLGAGLIAVGRAKDAIDVYGKGLESHPDNMIMRNRLTQAEHAAALDAKPAPRGGRSFRNAPPRAWIKSVYGTGDWLSDSDDDRWISDTGQHDAAGERMYRADGEAWGEPSWKVGEKVGLYFGGTYRVPVLVEVVGKPYFDEEFVARESGNPEHGRRWPWVTPVRKLCAVPLDDAPTLEDLGIERSSMQQRARLMLGDEQRDRLLKALRP